MAEEGSRDIDSKWESLPKEFPDLIQEDDLGDLQKIEEKHWRSGLGSQFNDNSVPDLSSILRKCFQERGGFDGDDREKMRELGVPESAFLEGCRYLLVENIKGTVGVVPVSEVKTTEDVYVGSSKRLQDPKPLYIVRTQLPTTSVASIIIGPRDEDNPNQGEVIWTLHPGLPIPTAKANVEDWETGDRLTLKQVQEKLPDISFLQVKQP